MIESQEQRLAAVISLCQMTEELLHRHNKEDVLAGLRTVREELQAGNMNVAFEEYKRLPRYDVAELWDGFDWMEGNQRTTDEKAELSVYLSSTLRALGDLRVHVLYNFDRPIADISREGMEKKIKELLSEYNARAPKI